MELNGHDVILKSGDIVLRPMTEDDWDIVMQWNNDPEVLYLADFSNVKSYDLSDIQNIYRSTSRKGLCFIIEYQGLPIGDCSLQRNNAPVFLQKYPNRVLGRIDLMIAKKMWGRGIGTRVIRMLSEFGFQQENMELIFGLVMNINQRSLKAFKKVGYEICDRRDLPDGSKARYEYHLGLAKENFNTENDDVYFLRFAIKQAERSRDNGENPFGAVLVHNGRIVARSTDQRLQMSDPTCHAELSLISTYCRKNRLNKLEGYTLYTSTEPCAMCAGAIHWARISKVVFSTPQEELQRLSNGHQKLSCDQIINSGHNRIEIVGPLLLDEGLKVFEGFTFGPKQSSD